MTIKAAFQSADWKSGSGNRPHRLLGVVQDVGKVGVLFRDVPGRVAILDKLAK